MTVNPFIGPDTLEPFVEAALLHGKGLFVLCRMSNPGSVYLQDQWIADTLVLQRIASLVSDLAKDPDFEQGLSPIGAVVGATAAADGDGLRRRLPNSVIPAPGLGWQGADPRHLVSLRGAAPHHLLIPISRGLLDCNEPRLPLDRHLEAVRSRLESFNAGLSGVWLF